MYVRLRPACSFVPRRKKHVACQKFRHHDFALPANMGQKWCQTNLPSDSVRRLTLPREFVGRAWDKGWRDWQIDRLFSPPDASVKGSRRFDAEATLACCVLFSCCRSNEVLRRTHGKDDRVLYTAKLSQGFKVVSPSRAWQGAGISTGGTKISVTGSETRTAKLRFEQGEATVMSKQKNCGVVVACSLLAAFALAPGAAAQT